MSILAWIVVGAIAGWLASLLVRGGGVGLIGMIIIGIIGALVGGWLSTSVFNLPYTVTGINLITIAVATAGAIVVLFITSLFRR